MSESPVLESDLEKIEKAAQGRNEGRKSRSILALALGGLAMLVVPVAYALAWLGVVALLQIADHYVFSRVANLEKSRISARRVKIMSATMIAVSTTSFCAISALLWVAGGLPGQLFAMLVAGGSLVHASVFLSQARFLYAASVLPFYLTMLFLPLYSYFVEKTLTIAGTVTVIGAVVLFLIATNKAYYWIQDVLSEIMEEKAKAETAAAQILALEQALNEHAMVARSDQYGVLLDVNEEFCRNTQFNREELLGKHISILDSGVLPTEFFEDMQVTLNAGEVWSGKIQNVRKDGSAFWGDTTISPISNNKGEIVECISIRRDITDLLEAREEADRANTAKSEFLAMMSHELRTPMNAVLGMAELLKGTKLDAQQREYITAVTDGGEMLMTVLNDILDISKIEAGKMQFESINIDVRHAICRLERLWAPNAKDKGIGFVCEIDDDVPSVIRGDITRIRQVIYNLLSNAVKFTEEGEVSLHVSAKPSGKDHTRISFAVKDTGVGISSEALSRLFTSFEQADKSVTRKFGGTGLGLSISKQLAELMGGDIKVTSTLGKGTCFTFSLKAEMVAAPDKSKEKTSQPKTESPAGKDKKQKLRILAAEDNALNQKVLHAFLKPLGHEIILANDGVEALEMLEAQEFDLVLMDVQMPRKDGLATSRELRASNGINADIPIIAMTANAMSGDRETCLEAGMSDYVPKPIDPRVLFTALAKASAQSRKLKAENKKGAVKQAASG